VGKKKKSATKVAKAQNRFQELLLAVLGKEGGLEVVRQEFGVNVPIDRWASGIGFPHPIMQDCVIPELERMLEELP
jgi:hypothetical protein